MGRDAGWRETVPEAERLPGRVNLFKIRINGGGYDAGGAYWGHGDQLWSACTTDGSWVTYFRAPTRDKAKAIVLAEMPGATFYR
jgi:hypothetical protein